MKARCLNQRHVAYSRYGGSGITIDPRWLSFECFLEDMGPRPPRTTLDRRDNSQGYSKSNCRWATRAEQSRNSTYNVLIEIDGEVKCLADWSKQTGIGLTTIRYRLSRGLSGKDLINPDRSMGKAMKRKTHCPQGHLYDDANTYRIHGSRKCRICNMLRARQLRASLKV